MRTFRPTVLAASVAALAACSEAGPVASARVAAEPAPLLAASGRAVQGSYVVVLKPGAAPRSVAAVAGVEPRFVYTAALTGFAADLNHGQLQALRHNPAVEYVEPDQVMEAMATPWGLDRIDQHFLPLNGVYTFATTASTVSAYVIDTGIQTANVEFGGRAANVYDAFGGTGQDCNGHGTGVAGVVGSSTYGVAKKVKLRGLRVLNCSGSGTTSGIIAAVDWVRVNHVRPAVANLSLGGAYSSALNTAVANLAAVVFTTVAAGNSASNACNFSPGSVPAAYTVAGSTITDAVMSGSNFGSCIDIFAPGKDIPTVGLSGPVVLSGSSLAAPHAAGVGAMFLAYNPGATASAVATWVTSNATVGVLSGVPAGTPNRLLYKSSL